MIFKSIEILNIFLSLFVDCNTCVPVFTVLIDSNARHNLRENIDHQCS